MRRARRLGAAVLLLCASVVASALVLEGGVLLVLGEQPKFPRRVVGAEFGVRINQPNARYRHKSADVTVHFRINGRGLRADREYPYEKAAGVRRIVSLGDSFTVGYEVEVEQTFSAVLERELRRRGHRIEVLNAGVSGYSTAEALIYFERELLRYEPDLVLISFFANDLADNARTGLFGLVDGALVETAQTYVPAGGLGNFLNRNSFFNWLAERSNAFVLLKERVTILFKARVLDRSARSLEPMATGAGPTPDQRLLAAALYERLYRVCQRSGIGLVIQTIPTVDQPQSPARLIDVFPLDEFPIDRPGLALFPALQALEPALGSARLYHHRSHGHWTPEAHRLSGEALAELIDSRGL